jgi:penicillin-binding protein 1A
MLLLLFLGAVAGIGTLAGLFAVYGADADLPDVSRLQDFRAKQVTRVLAADGKTVIGEIYEERRTVVPYRRLPQVLINAVVAAEDARFFEHEGLNHWGMVRAFFVNLRAGRYKQGGSTITQQVVKTFFLSPERTLRRKVQEVILARRLEQTLSKEQILELYLNQIYFGHRRYGVQEASRFYFGKDVERIGLAEASLLAGLPQGPERLSPVKHPQRARARQRYVLEQMVKQGFIEPAQARAVQKGPWPVQESLRRSTRKGARKGAHKGARKGARKAARKAARKGARKRQPATPHRDRPCAEYVILARKHLIARYGKKALPYLGQTVVTTCQPDLQRAARRALRRGLRALDRRQAVMRPGRPLRGKALSRTLKRLSRKQPRHPVPGRIYRGVVTALDDRTATATVSLGRATGRLDLRREPRYNPKGKPPSKVLRRHTVVHVSALGRARGDGPVPLRLAQGAQGAALVLDVQSREVLALVGGYDQRVGDFNRALDAVRQPGSTFKPIVYAAALQGREITPATRLPDAPHRCENWLRIRKRGRKRYRGHVTVREALARSVNSVACRVYERVGNARVRRLARQLGIRSALTEHLSLALGASGIRPLELAGAFASLAGGGRYLPPQFIRRVGGLPVERPAGERALSPQTSFVLTSLLTSVVRGGTGRRARLGRPAAGKTGTSNKNRDAWFVGYTPRLAAVVWVGHDDFRSLGRRETGGRTAAPIWARIMRAALRGHEKRDFPKPPAVITRWVDPRSGHAVAEHTPGARREHFLPGTAPETAPALEPEVDPGDHVLQDGQ